MGGLGSGRNGGRVTVENTIRLDISLLKRWKVLLPRRRVTCLLERTLYDQDLEIQLECQVNDPWDSWLRVRYDITDWHDGQDYHVDDKIFLTTTRPRFGGLRWWFACPRSHRRVRILHLPLGGRHFRSRRAYRLAYGSQRETIYDRALRRSRKLTVRLGGDPASDHYPEKPPRMRWKTYERIMQKISRADDVADERLVMVAARFLRR